jgi:hypothetical protein
MARWSILIVVAAAFSAVVVWSERTFGPNSGWFSLAIVWLPMTFVGIASRTVQIRLPASYHALRGFERSGRVYELVGVRAVKLLLRRGPLALFNPDLHLPSERSPDKLSLLAQRMCDAEASHAVLFVLTLPIVAHALVRGWWAAAVWTLALDLLVNGYPIMLQRYNRARLMRRFALPAAQRPGLSG